MVRPFDRSRVELSEGLGVERGIPKEEVPFNIVLIGNFSGSDQAGGKRVPIASRSPIPVDRDNVDKVLERIGPTLRLPMEGSEELVLRFRELEDFHPDRLLESVDLFRRLREVRRRLEDPATFPAGAEELGLSTKPQPSTRRNDTNASADSVVAAITAESGGSLLDDIVNESEAPVEVRRSGRPDQLQEFVQRVTRPHLVADLSDRQAAALEMIDRALSAQMRALVHTPPFQAQEAAWRSVFFLVRHVETSVQLKLHLIDISQEELCRDVTSSPDLRETGTYRLLVEKTVGTPGAEEFALLVGNFTFGAKRDDTEALRQIGKIAQAAGAPFIAAASPRLLGCRSLAETPHPREWKMAMEPEAAQAWDVLRASPEAAWIGLALPRFLLRLPYGKGTDPVESFDFEEMPGEPQHEDYLWGNPAFACALLLAQSFSEDGWEMRPGSHSEVGGLPLHVYKHNGESEPKPCAEALLTEEAAVQILEHGFMPLASLRGSDAVRVVRFQSIAEPLRGLAGGWTL
jgi:type VI secretion system protein ImpC